MFGERGDMRPYSPAPAPHPVQSEQGEASYGSTPHTHAVPQASCQHNQHAAPRICPTSHTAPLFPSTARFTNHRLDAGVQVAAPAAHQTCLISSEPPPPLGTSAHPPARARAARSPPPSRLAQQLSRIHSWHHVAWTRDAIHRAQQAACAPAASSSTSAGSGTNVRIYDAIWGGPRRR